MATPYIAGVAAALPGLHPGWTVEQLKSALVLTGQPVSVGEGSPARRAARDRGRGRSGRRSRARGLRRSAEPLLRPPGRPGRRHARSPARSRSRVTGTAARGRWRSSSSVGTTGVALTVPASVGAPATLEVSAAATGEAPEGEHTGFVVLSRDGVRRRIPFWFRVTRPRLPALPATELARTGTFRGNTGNGASTLRALPVPGRARAGRRSRSAGRSRSSESSSTGRPRTSAWRSSRPPRACAFSRVSSSARTRTG